MPQVLEQGISVDSHNGNHTQRKQGHRHDYDLDRCRYRQPHQFRISNQANQENCLDGIEIGFENLRKMIENI